MNVATSTIALAATAILTALTLGGCGGSGGHGPTPTTTPSTSATPEAYPTEEPGTDDELPSDGVMSVVYEEATTPEAIKGRDLMKKWHLLEGLAKDVNGAFKLPYDIPLEGAECGEANDFWSHTDKKVTLCYEDVDNSLTLYTDANDPDPEGSARRNAVGAFYHELGHMVIDIYDLPATGREEDVADQMAAYVLLERDGNGNFDADSVQAAKDTAELYLIASKQDDPASKDLLADVHTMNEARMFNFNCWIYGADPDGNADMVGPETLPEDRADGCEGEYNQLVKAWSTLLQDHRK